MSEIVHDDHCALKESPEGDCGPCDCEAGRIAMMHKGMTAHEAEISQSWAMLESFSFPPEFCGWPHRDIAGLLPEAIKCALDCVIRQRQELQAEVEILRDAVGSSHD